MAQVYETKNFTVETPTDKPPHISREDGGHLIIRPKKKVPDRTRLDRKKACELMKLTMIVGEAFQTAMKRQGVDVRRINYQDNGNWSVFKPGGLHFHLHVYGRAKLAKIQKYGEALYFPQRSTGFYDKNNPLTPEDIAEIQKQIKIVLNKKKYKDWRI